MLSIAETGRTFCLEFSKKKNYDGVMMQMVEKFQEGDFIAAVGLQSYVITHSYVAKYFEHYNDVPFKIFCLFSSPEILRHYERRFLSISELVKKIPPNSVNDLYGFAPQSNGKMSMKKIDLANDRYQRIWLVTANWINMPPLENMSQEVKEHLSDYLKFISSEVHDGVAV